MVVDCNPADPDGSDVSESSAARLESQDGVDLRQAYELVDQPVLQMELPVLPDEALRAGSPTGAARWAVDHSMDAVRQKFGRAAVGYASVALSKSAGVPDEFRELAEHEL